MDDDALLEEVEEPEDPKVPEETPELPETPEEIAAGSELSGRSGMSVSGVTSSEITPSGWEEAELSPPIPEEASELPEFSMLFEASEPETLLSEPVWLLVLLEVSELEEELLTEELPEGEEGPVEEALGATEEEIEELLLGFLPHPAKATAKTAANANNVLFIFKLPHFEDVLL